MKKFRNFRIQLVRIFLLGLVCAFFNSTKSVAQQQNAQWAFHLAFEDAMGANDTLWFLLDTAGTYPYSISGLYGEEPIEVDSASFQVWFYHPISDEIFEPYNTFMQPIDDTGFVLGGSIFAQNYALPLTVSWDSTLFTSDVLYEYGGEPINQALINNSYFFFTFQEGNLYTESGWDMTLTDHAEMPYFWWGDGDHFPLSINLSRGPLGTGVGVDEEQKAQFSVFPNPGNDYTILSFPKPVSATLRMYDSEGENFKTTNFTGSRIRLDLSDFTPGIYFIEIQDGKDKRVKKIVVSR